MSAFYIRITFLFYFFLLAVQIPNAGWAAEREETASSLLPRASSSFNLVEVEEISPQHTGYSNPLPTIEEYDDEADLSAQQPPTMPFQLGFEFQENKGLCEWALRNNNYQRKPFFRVVDQKSKKRLWTLVIDTSDIEFVTVPFTDEEELYLARCMDSILIAFNSLQETLLQRDSITFEDWTDLIAGKLNENGFIIGYFGSYELIREMSLIRPKGWVPTFSPQATIQHPLEYTIPLSFMLFGFDCPSIMFPFCGSLPSRNSLLAAQKEADSEEFGKLMQGYYKKKLSGLLFLHSITLNQITSVRDLNDTELLEETLDALENYHQIDPKMRLSLMSRRPFSSMFEDLGLGINYTERFFTVMRDNSSFMDDIAHFPRINYAEQFFHPESGEIRALRSFIPMFDPIFFETNRATLEKLLDQGVVSTTMLRNLRTEIVTDDFQPIIELSNHYFAAAVNSVANPQKRYNISLEIPGVQSQASSYDALSPPWFLDMENSMGALKQDFLPRYGEAVVEFRCIRDAQPCFLKRVNLNPKLSGKFLTDPNNDLKNQALSLFRYLRQFGKPKDFSDFALGMTVAVLKH